ncbi:hypothetical protein SAMN06265337_1223 [Hymenobacter gelipurpurascens]|uniref:Uncharacterized protein n=1 Tax=Hymenobacter gelipurpurascens TaxID=89968 RepID=A0A212TGG5_9BACT|nr:hypothetical protein [Hymenobacter gelipurpurascens]SNC65138.1 hypothetical protein SAMN06265337_1223 [Hymenobacter gelipurpurascens]
MPPSHTPSRFCLLELSLPNLHEQMQALVIMSGGRGRVRVSFNVTSIDGRAVLSFRLPRNQAGGGISGNIHLKITCEAPRLFSWLLARGRTWTRNYKQPGKLRLRISKLDVGQLEQLLEEVAAFCN